MQILLFAEFFPQLNDPQWPRAAPVVFAALLEKSMKFQLYLAVKDSVKILRKLTWNITGSLSSLKKN